MQKTLKISIAIMIGLSLIVLSGCNNKWKRIDTIQSIAIIQLSSSYHIAVFNKKGQYQGSLKNNEYEKEETTNSMIRFYRNIENNWIKSLESIFTLQKSNIIKDARYLDYTDPDNKIKINQLFKRGKSDGIISIKQEIGVIKKKASGGSAITYELVSKIKFQIADEKGFIGEKAMFVRSGVVKQSTKRLPAFKEQAFDRLLKEVSKKLVANLKLIKQ